MLLNNSQFVFMIFLLALNAAWIGYQVFGVAGSILSFSLTIGIFIGIGDYND